jgi:hypothetical protein
MTLNPELPENLQPLVTTGNRNRIESSYGVFCPPFSSNLFRPHGFLFVADACLGCLFRRWRLYLSVRLSVTCHQYLNRWTDSIKIRCEKLLQKYFDVVKLAGRVTITKTHRSLPRSIPQNTVNRSHKRYEI